MALKIIDAKKSGFPHDGRFGCVHLIFDRDIDADSLRVSIFKLLGREYLGRSTPPKANWTPARSHFFEAPVVLRGAGQTVFSLGPEVTTFIPDESMLEIASEDNLVRDTAVWSGVSVDFTWPGPPPEPVRPAPKPPQPQQPVPKAQTPEPPPPAEPEVVTPPPEEVKVVEPPPPPDPPPQAAVPPKPPAPPARWGRRAAMLALGVLVAGAIGVVTWGTQHRDYLCDHFHLFCDPEVVAYHQAKDCAAPKACGVSECLANYRNTYPNGRFSAELDDIAVKKGRPCIGDTPAPPAADQEKVAYDHVVACTASVTCGASACAADYRQSFANGAHKADVDWIVSQKDAACRAEAAEKEVYDQAVGCARTRTCGALECIADYRRSYPNGRYKAQIDQIAQQQNAVQCVDREKVEFDQADTCARAKGCGALDCLVPYRRDYPNGRFKAQIDQLAQRPNAAACPDLDREAYDRAERCAEPLRCGADHCLVEYRRDFPNGKYRSLIEQIGTLKGPDCQREQTQPPPPSLPAFVPIQPGDDPGIRNCNARNLEPIAQMICKDSDMARANGELQKAFEARLKSTNDTGGLRSSERAWIEQRDRDCAIPPSGSWEINDLRKVKNCFLDKTRARTDELR